MKKLYIIDLEPAEREQLTALVEKGTVAAYRRRHAQILLLADQGAEGPAWRDAQVASHVGVTVQNVEKIRQRCVLEGLEAALGRRKRSRERATVLDGKGEAQLIAIACSEPPVGRARWTLHMLCDELKRRRIVRSISHETVRQVLKKKSAQAVAPGDVVHPAAGERGLRVQHGERPGSVYAAVRCGVSGDLHGRVEQAVRTGGAATARAAAWPSSPL